MIFLLDFQHADRHQQPAFTHNQTIKFAAIKPNGFNWKCFDHMLVGFVIHCVTCENLVSELCYCHYKSYDEM